MPRTNPRFHRRPGYCKHGVYVGGCGIDWMCPRCEMGDDIHWRDEYRYQKPMYNIVLNNSGNSGYRDVQSLAAYLVANRDAIKVPFTIQKLAHTPNGWQTMYTRTFSPAQGDSQGA